MKCIICRSPMKTQAVDDVEIDFCPKCGGVWLDEGEMERLAGLDPFASRRLKCSHCHTEMVTNVIHGVEIDVCPVCHTVWLDRGELEKLSGVNPRTGRKNILYEYLENELIEQLGDDTDE